MKKFFSILNWILFIGYSLLMIWEVFLGPYRSIGGRRNYNLIPFKTIYSFINNHSQLSFQSVFINLAGNVITFIPLGFFLPMVFQSFRSIRKAITCYALIIIAVEALQFILNVGVLDVDDIILNLLGCLLGYWANIFLETLRNKSNTL